MDNTSRRKTMDSTRLEHSMKSLLQAYDKLRGYSANVDSHYAGDSSCRSIHMWDVVVLTACDKDQEEAYNIQLRQKVLNNSLPKSFYLVVPDQSQLDGSKIGTGGSTFLVIKQLKIIFSDHDLRKKRVLLIHAGGWSQRYPSASVLGKLFMPLPIGSFHNYNMLDVKLAIYLPFVSLMQSGIFVTSSDDIELFDNDLDKIRQICSDLPSGFVALGHPSTLEVGTGHGVFVLPCPYDSCAPTLLPCSRVLQKPSVSEMFDTGAVKKDHIGNSEIISDSAYWFDMDVADKLYDVFQTNGLSPVEIDCYGDFMRPLGTLPSVEYIERTSNPTLKSVRQLLFDALSGTPFQVLVLPGSQFIHLGTMPEYLEAILQNQPFRTCFSISSNLIHSILHEKCQVSPHSVLEYCYFLSPLTVGANCLISGCSNESLCSWTTDTVLSIGPGTFMHTVVLKKDDQRLYCTLFCGVQDDIKAEFSAASVKMLGNPVGELLSNFGAITPSVSLWTLPVFPVCRFPGQSFLESLKILQALTSGQTVDVVKDRSYMSMSQVLRHKDVAGMLEFRERLRVEPQLSPVAAANAILTAGIFAVKPGPLIEQHLLLKADLLSITDFNGQLCFQQSLQQNVHLFAIGKGAAGMMDALLKAVHNRIRQAVLFIPSEMKDKLAQSHLPSHPKLVVLYGGKDNLADDHSIVNTDTIIGLIEKITQPDIIIFAISGGTSALLVSPVFPVTLADKLKITRMLMKSGAPIQDLNAVRGALSNVKNGGLTRYIQPGVSCVSLILSDIIGDPVHFIGGGPTVAGQRQTESAVSVLEKYGLWTGAPQSVKDTILVGDLADHGKAVNLTNIVIGNNTVALRACQHEAVQLGYQSIVLTTRLEGNVRSAAANFAELVKSILVYRAGGPSPSLANFTTESITTIDWNLPLCVLTGGETVINVVGRGKGGRNQEMVLAFAVACSDIFRLQPTTDGPCVEGVFISCGSDGQDGPNDAAGASTKFPYILKKDESHAAQQALDNNDSYNFFSEHDSVGSLIKMGLTGTNVMDLQILLIE